MKFAAIILATSPFRKPRVALEARAILKMPAALAVRLLVAIFTRSMVHFVETAQGTRLRRIGRVPILHDAAQVAVSHLDVGKVDLDPIFLERATGLLIVKSVKRGIVGVETKDAGAVAECALLFLHVHQLKAKIVVGVRLRVSQPAMNRVRQPFVDLVFPIRWVLLQRFQPGGKVLVLALHLGESPASASALCNLLSRPSLPSLHVRFGSSRAVARPIGIFFKLEERL